MKKFRKYFVSGLLVWVPIGLTIIVVKFFIELTDNLVPSAYKPAQLLHLNIPGTGILLIVVIVLITGILTNNYLGRRLFDYWNNLLNKIPIIRIIYKSIKQVSDTLLTNSGNSFKKVLLIEYPRRGLWTIAFLTGNYRGESEKEIGCDIVNVYMPTTPNPTSGFFLMIPVADVKELKMSVDEALKLIISGGIVAPDDLDK